MSLASVFLNDAAIAAAFTAEAEVAAMVRFEAALAEAEAEAGMIDPAATAAVAEAVAAFAPDLAAIRQGMARDGVPVPVLVGQLRTAVGREHGAAVHHGATSQDAIDTGLMLRLRSVLDILHARLDGLVATLATLAAEQGARPLMAQTRMQAALPFTAADKIATWARPLAAHRDRLAALSRDLPVQLGGPIGTGGSFGSGYAAVRASIAARLGLADREPWHADRTPVLDVAGALQLVTGTLGKVGQDLALMVQDERRAVTLPGGGASSAMAHKRNPVGAEVLVALGRFDAGLLGTLAQGMIHENERSGAAWTLEWLVLPQMAQAAGAATLQAATLLDGVAFAEA